VALDLATRGAALPASVQINTPAPQPSLVLAQRLYRDPTRADQLVVFADPVHPAFMPTSFGALAS
jgi:prophage DNA circulation protein